MVTNCCLIEYHIYQLLLATGFWSFTGINWNESYQMHNHWAYKHKCFASNLHLTQRSYNSCIKVTSVQLEEDWWPQRARKMPWDHSTRSQPPAALGWDIWRRESPERFNSFKKKHLFFKTSLGLCPCSPSVLRQFPSFAGFPTSDGWTSVSVHLSFSKVLKLAMDWMKTTTGMKPQKIRKITK